MISATRFGYWKDFAPAEGGFGKWMGGEWWGKGRERKSEVGSERRIAFVMSFCDWKGKKCNG